MKTELPLTRHSSRLISIVFTAACFAGLSIALMPDPAEGGSLVIPAWSFARGNVRIHADPDQYADAGPVVGGGQRKPWGWSVEYDVELPVTSRYTLQICYASAEARPVEVFFDRKRLGHYCNGVTFALKDGKPQGPPTWKSSGARWDPVAERGKFVRIQRNSPLAQGRHTIRIYRHGPLPHLVALRMETDAEFPKDWKPPRYTVRNPENIPAAHRQAFPPDGGVKVAARPVVELLPTNPGPGSLKIPAWTFDRGNAEIFASPDLYADRGPLAGGGQSGQTAVEYDIEVPVAGDFTLAIRYAAAEPRPVEIFLDGRRIGACCTGITFASAPYTYPPQFSAASRFAVWEGMYDHAKGRLLRIPVAKGKHTLRLARRGPLPNMAEIRMEAPVKFPDGWTPPARKVDLSRVPPTYRSAFLPANAVNTAALRLAVREAIEAFGPRYPDGPAYLKQLDALEARQQAVATKAPTERQAVENELSALRRRVLMARPELNFDKVLFIKRKKGSYGSTYGGGGADTGGNLCILSPVAPDGKVTPLAPQLEGGVFDRFDLSFDAKRVVFGYSKEGEPFRIYEIRIDPDAGRMEPGSLRQLTFSGRETEAMRRSVSGRRRFDDMDPCYLPNGKIMFVSTRAQRIVFCQSGATVTTMYIMDADGKNLRRVSESPLNETSPSMLPDGRVIYRRWEYMDKGLGNAQSLWVMRPDGTGVDHVYKNLTPWPAGMSTARAVPGGRWIVTIGGNHHNTEIGPVVLVDMHGSRRSADAMTCITPETGYPDPYGDPAGEFGAFADPYALSKDIYLVSHVLGVPRGQRQGQYDLYVLDRWGNRTELHTDPELCSFEPMPIRARPTPMEVADAAEKLGAAPGDASQETGVALIQDICQGMTGIERGKVKYVRVMGALEWPWDQYGMYRLGADSHRKKIYGVAKVREDGSACFTVPAYENIFFQALDKDFMALQHMATFINVMPGENRGCIGCHEDRRKAPGHSGARPLAMRNPPQALAPQPGDSGPRMVDFNADVQPVLTKHCVRCHSGKKPKAGLDFSGIPMKKYDFSSSYKSMMDSDAIRYRFCVSGRAHVEAVPPLTHGARVSRLTEMLRQGHNKVKLSPEEFLRITTWIDANVPFYGTYPKKPR